MSAPACDEREVLWSLIKNLDPSEKHHFLRKFKLRQANGANLLYVRLFEWICRHEKPDDNALLQDLGPELTKKNLCYIRHYLQNQLVESLGEIEGKKNVQATLIHNVPVIRKLFQRGQHTMAIRLWKQSLRLARKLEDFTLIKLLKDEYLYFEMYYSRASTYSDLLRVYQDRILDVEEYARINHLEELCFQSILIRKKAHFDLSGGMKKQLQRLANDPMLQKRPDTNPFSRYHFWSLTNGIICYLQSDFEASIAYCKPLLLMWQNRPEHIAYRPEVYLETLYTYTYAAMHLRQFDEIEANYHHRSNKSIKDRYNHYYFTVLKYLTFLRIYHKKGDYHAVAKLLTKMKRFLPEWLDHILPDLQRPLLMSVAISCFVLDQLKDADAYCRQTLFLGHDEMRPDQIRVTHLFLLLVSYEMKNEWVFKNQYKACYQFFYRNKCLTGFEKELMTTLNKTFPFQKNEKTQARFKAALARFKKDNSKIKIQICHIFNFQGWIDSRIAGIAYREWVQKEIGNNVLQY